jgi:hypothetical protein
MKEMNINISSKSEWIEMFPFGIAMAANNTRPVMIFKDKAEKRVLPVWLSPMDAGIAVAQANSRYPSGGQVSGSPHELSMQIMRTLHLEIEKCLFKTVKGHHQYLEIHLRSTKGRKLAAGVSILESPADDAISFCLRSGCKFFATGEYIERSRVLEGEMMVLGSQMGLSEQNPHPYLN